MKFFIGCAIWAYKGWVGQLYPQGTRTANFLYLYLPPSYAPALFESAIYGRVGKADSAMVTDGSANLFICPLSNRSAIAQHSASPVIPTSRVSRLLTKTSIDDVSIKLTSYLLIPVIFSHL